MYVCVHLLQVHSECDGTKEERKGGQEVIIWQHLVLWCVPLSSSVTSLPKPLLIATRLSLSLQVEKLGTSQQYYCNGRGLIKTRQGCATNRRHSPRLSRQPLAGAAAAHSSTASTERLLFLELGCALLVSAKAEMTSSDEQHDKRNNNKGWHSSTWTSSCAWLDF